MVGVHRCRVGARLHKHHFDTELRELITSRSDTVGSDLDQGAGGSAERLFNTQSPSRFLHQTDFRLRVAANGSMSGFSVCRNPLLAKFSTRCSSRETSTSRRLLRPYACPATSVSARIILRLTSIGSPGGAQTST